MTSTAIVTKYHSPANVKGARISVTSEGHKTKFYDYDYGSSDPHSAAVLRYVKEELHEQGAWIKGMLPENRCAFVKYQTPKGLPYAPMVTNLYVDPE